MIFVILYVYVNIDENNKVLKVHIENKNLALIFYICIRN